MSEQKKETSGSTARRGLTTVALLKAQIDSGKDYLEMFMPFVVDAIGALDNNDFDANRLRNEVQIRHGLSIPLNTLQTLLKRLIARKAVRREGGRYFRVAEKIATPTIPSERRAVEREIRALADALISFADQRGQRIGDEQDAIALLFEFLSDNQLQLLADDDIEIQYQLDTAALSLEQTRLVARFVTDVTARNPQLANYLSNVVEGFVLQNVLLLREIGTAARSFNHLQVYFDSNVVFAALGYNGEAAKLATREAFELLKGTDALTRTFDVTVAEMRSILGVYELNLATPDGKERLFPTELTRYFLTNRFTPGDIRQEIALLEHNIRKIGLEIVATPSRVADYTHDELSLSQMLKRPYEKGNEPRVTHDVDCVAAVLTLRRGQVTEALDSSRAVFVTSSRHVVQTVTRWYESTDSGGAPPIVHHLTLSNFAWLKRPASAAKLKLHELVALCAAALRPSRDTWDRFLRHLKKLENGGEVTSDETVAILVSSLTDKVLAEAEESGDDDIDSDTLSEVVDRVKDSYREDADRKVEEMQQQAEIRVAEARTALEQARAERVAAKAENDAVLETLDRNVDKIAAVVSGVAGFVLTATLALGAFLLLPSVFDRVSPKYRPLSWVAVILVAVFGFLGWQRGIHVGQIREHLKNAVRRKIRAWLLTRDSDR